jgi:hypothetical protein
MKCSFFLGITKSTIIMELIWQIRQQVGTGMFSYVKDEKNKLLEYYVLKNYGYRIVSNVIN